MGLYGLRSDTALCAASYRPMPWRGLAWRGARRLIYASIAFLIAFGMPIAGYRVERVRVRRI